jgi:hypothetical protein
MYNSKLEPKRKKEFVEKKLDKAFFECEEAIFDIQSVGHMLEDQTLCDATSNILVQLDQIYDHINQEYRYRNTYTRKVK